MNHIAMSSIKEFLCSKKFAVFACIMSVMGLLQWHGIDLPFFVWFPIVSLASLWADERVNRFMMITNFIVLVIIMATYYAIFYLQPFFEWCNF